MKIVIWAQTGNGFQWDKTVSPWFYFITNESVGYKDMLSHFPAEMWECMGEAECTNPEDYYHSNYICNGKVYEDMALLIHGQFQIKVQQLFEIQRTNHFPFIRGFEIKNKTLHEVLC